MAHWIRVSAKAQSMNVVQRCANILSIHTAQALGHLTSLWSWLADETDDGDTTQFTDDQIEQAAVWTGEAGRFAWFVREKHTDKQGRIRDWAEYMGPMVAIRRNARDRMKRRRELQKQQDVDADREFGGGRSAGSSYEQARCSENNGDVRTNTTDVHTNQSDVRTKNSIRIELRKSIRTTGMHLGRELDLVSSESRDVQAFKSKNVLDQKHLDASQVQGIELVRTFCTRFYGKDEPAMFDALVQLRGFVRKSGPALVIRAMNETLDKPPSKNEAAIVFVSKKLESGHLHETRTETGELVTEALANDGRKLGRDTTANLMSVAPELFAGIKSMPVDPRKKTASGAWNGTAPPS